MDLLLLFVVGIVISEYTERRSKLVNIFNSVVFIFFSVLIFYGSNNSVVMYAAKNTLSPMFYTSLHNALRFSFILSGIHISSYYLLLLVLAISMIAIATCFTVAIVKQLIKIAKKNKAEKIVEKKHKFSFISNENKNNKLYLVFGAFLS